MEQFDVVVIGAGPGGYVAAIRCAQLGMSVAIVDKRQGLGGTCLNVGCIPSKALLDSSEHFHQAQHKFETHGIDVTGLKVNWKQMLKRKQDVIDSTVGGISYLMDKNKIKVFQGTGSFVDANTVKVEGKVALELKGQHVIIATGSEVMPLPSVPVDGKRIITSTEALELKEIPKSMIVIGGGVIGVELGSVYARLGTEVSVVEFMPGLIPTMDRELGKGLERSLKKNLKFKYHFNTKVTGAKATAKKVTVTAEGKKGEVSLEAEYVLVSIGRRAFTDGLGLEKIGVSLDERGRVPINGQFQTSVPNVYAIGDVVAGAMLAHKASEEGVCAAEFIAGQKPHLNYNAIPGVVYTWPEVASVGKTEEELSAAGIKFKKGSFPFKASGRARASEESEGFVKVLADESTDELLGVHMIGPRCADMIAEAALAIEFRASAEDIGIISHPHPTFTESFKEAALGASGDRMIHL